MKVCTQFVGSLIQYLYESVIVLVRLCFFWDVLILLSAEFPRSTVALEAGISKMSVNIRWTFGNISALMECITVSKVEGGS